MVLTLGSLLPLRGLLMTQCHLHVQVWPFVPTTVTVRDSYSVYGRSIGAWGPWWPYAQHPGPRPGLCLLSRIYRGAMPFSVVFKWSVLSVRYPGDVQPCLPLGLCPCTSLCAYAWSVLSALDLFCLSALAFCAAGHLSFLCI